MAKKKRTRNQRERDLALISELYLGAEPQHVIVTAVLKNYVDEDFTLTQQQISYDLGVLRRRWQQSQLVNIDEAKGRELERIDWIECEARAAWVRSQQDAETVVNETGGTHDGAVASSGKLKNVVTTKGQVGDRSFLAEVRECVKERCKILGLHAPTKVAPVTPDGKESYQPLNLENLDDADIDRLGELFAKAES